MFNSYPLTPSTEPNAFEFTTEGGSQYYLYFRNISHAFNGLPVFDFGFLHISEGQLIEDDRISHTICEEADKWLAKNHGVLLYIPMDDEVPMKVRTRKFDQWYGRLFPLFVCNSPSKNRVILKYAEFEIPVTVLYKASDAELAESILGSEEELFNYALSTLSF